LLEISKSRSNDAPLFAALGALAQSRNEIAKAKEFYKTALTADPDFDAALDGIFDIAFIQEDWPLCLVYSDKLLESEPRYGRIIAMRGEAFARLGQIDKAIAEWEKAVEIDPGFEVLRQMLVDAYSQQGNNYQAEVHAALLRKLQSATIPDSIKGVR
jgi:tetratricopeptide (TPR) repeat protein